jgi:uncharacterized protein (DUF2336 family)
MIVDQFLTWIQTASPDGRCRATAALARSYLVAEIEDADRAAIEATLTVLLDDPDPDIARTIADVLAPSRLAPRHLILALADGPGDIAAIVLEQSPLLIEAELVDFLGQGTATAQIAIARRDWLSPGVSAAIAEVCEIEACVELARNPTASIPTLSLLTLAERFGHDPALREAMFARAHLPIEVRHCLTMQGSDPYDETATGQRLRQERGEASSGDIRDRMTVRIAATARADELPRFVEYLRSTGQLTTALLLRAVTHGDVRFLQEALTLLSGLPRRRVEGLLVEGRESACHALFQKAGLPPRIFPAFIAALDVQREFARSAGTDASRETDDHRFAARVVDRVLARCSATKAVAEDDLIVLLRRFSTEAARNAARSFVADLTRRPPLMLPAPDASEAELSELGFAGADQSDAYGADATGDHVWSEAELLTDVSSDAAIFHPEYAAAVPVDNLAEPATDQTSRLDIRLFRSARFFPEKDRRAA